jgi:Mg-chelatase subunit ChlD
VRAARRHAAHLRDIVVKGESPLASAIMAAAAFAFIAPLVALVIVLALAAAHYAT